MPKPPTKHHKLYSIVHVREQSSKRYLIWCSQHPMTIPDAVLSALKIDYNPYNEEYLDVEEITDLSLFYTPMYEESLNNIPIVVLLR